MHEMGSIGASSVTALLGEHLGAPGEPWSLVRRRRVVVKSPHIGAIAPCGIGIELLERRASWSSRGDATARSVVLRPTSILLPGPPSSLSDTGRVGVCRGV